MKTLLRFVVAATIAAAQLALSVRADGNRIEEASFVPIGGIDQWVTIRGDDRNNPVLLHVHGGPGVAFSAFTDEFAPYETDFTIVQWDQRGSGRTFSRYGKETPEVTLDRIARDGIELAEHLQDRLGKQKIVVFGHSLGSIVATDMVRRAPELFAAYVGTGQFASFDGTVQAQLVYLRKGAEAARDADLGAQLDAIATLDSQGLAQFGAINRLLSTRVPADDAAFLRLLQSRTPEVMTPEELTAWQAGRQASADWLLREVRQVDLFATTPRIEVPFILIQGSDDVYTPTELAIAYFEHVGAPAKELVIVENAGHFPHLTHREEFLTALVRTARRLGLE